MYLVRRLIRFFVELAELTEAGRRHHIPDVIGRAQLTILVPRAKPDFAWATVLPILEVLSGFVFIGLTFSAAAGD